ncbi:MAG: response regulator [Desulfobacterota bacterium]|nr:response regulator [Thermodesulfobacteriota bacterium]
MNPALPQPIRIWIAEDEDELRELLKDFLIQEGRVIRTFRNGAEVVTALDRDSLDLLLTDLVMPEVDGIELLHRVKRRHPDCVVILMTGYASLDSALQAIRGGAYDYIRKPFKLEELAILIENACEKIRLHRENRDLLRMLRETKEELERLKGVWEDHLDQVLRVCWLMFREKRPPEIDWIVKQIQPPVFDPDPKRNKVDERAIESLQRLVDLRREGSITEEEFSTFKQVLMRRLKEG